MDSKDTGKNKENAVEDRDGKIVERDIEEEMKTAYIDYAMSVIVSRALPDVRDGLKLMLSNEVLFPSIYVATVSIASPILNNKKIIYGVGIGILGFILARFMGKEGIYVAIVIMNIILIILEKLGEVVAKKS